MTMAWSTRMPMEMVMPASDMMLAWMSMMPQCAQQPHHQEREQHRQRQRDADDERAADVQQDQEDGDGGDDHLVPHDLGQRVDGPGDQPRAVVGRDDAHALGQARLQLLDLLLDALR